MARKQIESNQDQIKLVTADMARIQDILAQVAGVSNIGDVLKQVQMKALQVIEQQAEVDKRI